MSRSHTREASAANASTLHARARDTRKEEIVFEEMCTQLNQMFNSGHLGRSGKPLERRDFEGSASESGFVIMHIRSILLNQRAWSLLLAMRSGGAQGDDQSSARPRTGRSLLAIAMSTMMGKTSLHMRG